jgi:phospholipase C
MKYPIVSGCLAAAFAVSSVAYADEDNGHGAKTPIKHLVVIFQENVSFDHYFGTYPNALNLSGETPFQASPQTPMGINTLVTPLDTTNHFKPLMGVDLIHSNPNNSMTAPGNGRTNGAGASNPIRLSPAQALTADQGHNEGPEESAYDNGKMDGFPAWVGTPGPPPAGITTTALVMGYYDGNTVTAMWNYAQHFALNDNNYTTQFGPSTPGALNLISGQTNGLDAYMNIYVPGTMTLAHSTHEAFGDAAHLTSNITVIGDGDPLGDTCSNPAIDQVRLHGKNVGDLLNEHGITWGSFMGGFDLTVVNPNGTTGCARLTQPAAGTVTSPSVDYIPHHAWLAW